MTDVIDPTRLLNRPPDAVGTTVLLKPIRHWIVLAAVLQMLSAGLVLAPLIGVSQLVQVLSLVQGERATAAWHIILISCGCLAGGVALRGLAELTSHLADNTLALSIRRQLAQRMLHAPLGWFDANSSGRIKQGMQDDVTAIHHLVAHAWLNLANAAATLLCVYGYLLWIDWRMTLVTLVPLPLFLVMYAQVMRGSQRKMAEYGVALERVNQSVVEFVQGIAVVKTFGQQGKAHQAYRRAVDSFRDFFLDWAGPLIKPECLATVLISPITLLLLVFGGGTLFISLGMLTLWQLLPFTVIVLGISTPVTTLGQSAQSLQMAQGALRRLSALLAIPQQAEPVSGQRPNGNEVVFDHLHFHYDGQPSLLHDISLRLQPGTLTALVGASGAGKTTLAKLLLRFVEPQQGQILLGGIPLAQIDSLTLYRRIGAVFQNVQLLRMSVFDNIALGDPEADEQQVMAAARAAQIHDRILALPRGYHSVYGEDACLSGGEAQRISIARALLHRPAVLVLDEPTAQADAESEAAIQAACNMLLAQQHYQAVLVIAHRLETVMFADNIVVMSQGHIVEQGQHDALLAAEGEYARMWSARQCDTQETLCC